MICGGTLLPNLAAGTPLISYNDWNCKLAERYSTTGFSPMPLLSEATRERVIEQEAAVFSRTTHIFTMSEHLRRSFLEDWKISADRVTTAFGGPNITLDATPPAEYADRRPTVLFVGKEFERKGGEVLVDAFLAVRRRIPSAVLNIVGPEECPTSVRGVPGLAFIGRLDPRIPSQFARLSNLYSSATVFCLPSLYEPFGCVVVEAMMAGLPCVVSDFGALPEIVDDSVTGCVVRAGDKEALAERLIELLTRSEAAATMGYNARKRAEQCFSWRRAAETVSDTLLAQGLHARGAID